MKYLYFFIVLISHSHIAICQANKLDSLLSTALELDPDSARNIFLQAEKIDASDRSKAEINYYKLYWHTKNNHLDSAVQVGEVALSTYIELHDTARIAQTRHKLMVNYVRMGWFEEALAQNQASFDWAELMKDTAEIIHFYSDFGFIYHDFKQYERGITYSKKAFPILKQYSEVSPSNYIDIYEMIAINFDDWGQQDSAIYYHKKAIAFKPKLQEESELQNAYNNIGNSLIKKGDFQQAKKYIEKALAINKLKGSDYNLATNYTNLGTIAYQLGNYTEADLYFTKALTHSKSSQSVEKLLDIYQQLFLYHKSTDQLAKAITYQEQYIQLSDSIFKAESAQKIAYMEVKYDTKRKEEAIVQQKTEIAQQIAKNERNVAVIIGLLIVLVLIIVIALLLRNKAKRNKQLLIQQQTIKLGEAQIEATLRSQELERKRFAEDLHDGFGQLISTLRLNMRNFSTKDIVENLPAFEHSEKILDEMHREIRAIAFNLMPITLIQEGLLGAIKEFAIRINKSKKIQIVVSSFELNKRFKEVFEVAIYRIIQEWVNNVLKYAEATKITIQLDQYETELILIIEDNGKGFDTNQLFKSQGNGWRNIQTRANLIKSQIEIDSDPARLGTSFILTAPIIAYINPEKQVNTAKSV